MPTRTLSAGHALLIIVGALVIGLLLNAGDLLETARRQSPGLARTLSVGVMEPIAAATDAVGLDTPRAAIDQWMGRAEPSGDSVVAGDAPSPPTTIPAAVPAQADTTTSTTLPTPTEAAPLSLFVAGDSMVGQYGPVLAGRAERSGVMEADYFFEFSSGLSRPDFFDWSAKLAEIRAEHDPDVLVLYLGGNDAQDILGDDGSFLAYAVDSEPWHAEYRSRVRGLMTELDATGMRTYWMGMPVVRSATQDERYQRLNAIYAEEAAGFDGVTFVDTTDWFVDESGAYSEYLPDESGTLTDMRQGDGIHLTTAGAERLAERVFPIIAADHGLPG